MSDPSGPVRSSDNLALKRFPGRRWRVSSLSSSRTRNLAPSGMLIAGAGDACAAMGSEDKNAMIAQKEMRTAVIPTPNGELRNEDLDVPESGNAALPEETEVQYAEDDAKLNGGSLCGSGVGHFLAQVFPDGFRHFEKS